jgi:hypothetical protein
MVYNIAEIMQSCTKKAKVMYTGQGNKEQVSQDLKDGFLNYLLITHLLMLTTFRPNPNNYAWPSFLNPKLNNYAL